jgi:hypothetical protein
MSYLYSVINLMQSIIAQKQRGERLLSEGVYAHWFDLYDEYVARINESIENSTRRNT